MTPEERQAIGLGESDLVCERYVEPHTCPENPYLRRGRSDGGYEGQWCLPCRVRVALDEAEKRLAGLPWSVTVTPGVQGNHGSFGHLPNPCGCLKAIPHDLGGLPDVDEHCVICVTHGHTLGCDFVPLPKGNE